MGVVVGVWVWVWVGFWECYWVLVWLCGCGCGSVGEGCGCGCVGGCGCMWIYRWVLVGKEGLITYNRRWVGGFDWVKLGGFGG